LSEPHPFERTLRSLQGDGYGSTLAWTALVLVLLAAWMSWLLFARVPVYVTSTEARLEVANDSVRVEAAVGGELQAVRIEVGDRVHKGEELFTIATLGERRLLTEERARQTGLREQLTAMRQQQESRQRELRRRRDADVAALEQAEAELQAALAASELAASEAARAERLAEDGLSTRSERERLGSLAEQRRHQVEAARRKVAQVRASSAAAEEVLQTGLAEVRQDVAALDAELAASAEVVARLAEEVARRSVRAPAAGVVAEIAARRVGAQVEVGQHLASLIPEAELGAVASFEPRDALGRIQPGQRGEVRLLGFSWTEFGSLEARIARVSAEPRDGRVRVELSLPPPRSSSLPMRHGLPATVLVRVDETSPLSLVLRSVGHRSARATDDPPGSERP
jgi:multidrug resistance efflux pump